MYRHPSHRDNWLPNQVEKCHPWDFLDCQDQYAVWAPGTMDSCVRNDAFNLYAMEIEEERERAQMIEKFIAFLSNTDDPNNPQNQWNAAEYSGICEFSPAEQQYVENEVARRYAKLY